MLKYTGHRPENIHKEDLIMANQTELLNVSDEMKLNDKQQIIEGQEHDEELCSSSLDTTEELYSSSAPDTCGDGCLTFQGR